MTARSVRLTSTFILYHGHQPTGAWNHKRAPRGDRVTGAVVTAAIAKCEPRRASDGRPPAGAGLGRSGGAGITESFRMCWLLWVWRTQTAAQAEVQTPSARERLSEPHPRSWRLSWRLRRPQATLGWQLSKRRGALWNRAPHSASSSLSGGHGNGAFTALMLRVRKHT